MEVRGWAGAGAGDDGAVSRGDPVSDAGVFFADALRRLVQAGIPLEAAADHGVSARCINAIRTTMAWIWIGIARWKTGRARRTAGWRW